MKNRSSRISWIAEMFSLEKLFTSGHSHWGGSLNSSIYAILLFGFAGKFASSMIMPCHW